jgi:hypothetical protein
MNEPVKTVLFLACAAVLGGLAWMARPADPGRGVIDDTGEQFAPAFTDPLQAFSLEVIEFDEENGTARVFKVARHEGVWSILSHENYAADAENRFADAAAAMVGLTKGVNRSDNRTDHELYGVNDPTEAQAGTTGVGTRITFAGDSGSLIDLIVGTAVKDSPGQRYVRVPGVDRVYLCSIDLDKFSTDFADWIEKDLLQMSGSDVTGIVVKDYSIDEFSQRVNQNEPLLLTFDARTRAWSLEGLGPDESLLDTRLSEMTRGLSDLEIVDVHRKPAGLSSELRAEDALQLDTEAVTSLQSSGYYIVGGRLLSNQGETVVRTSDGVQYVLRFGEIADGGRYLFVTAEFNEGLLEKPEILELPELASLGIDDEATEPAMSESMERARARLTEENDAKQQAYQEKLDAGRDRARELTDRFADWYYVISDEVYENVRFTRPDIVEVAGAVPADG